jgi:PAS domain S-box-containing protein
MLWRSKDTWKNAYAISRSNLNNGRTSNQPQYRGRACPVVKEVNDMETYTHEWLCQHIVDNTQEAIIFADHEGMIRLWNIGAETIFGYTASEVLGQSLELIIPERLRAQHRVGYRRVMATGVTQYARKLLAVPATRKDGARISLEFTVTLIRGADREIVGIAAILRDVTARWEREKTIQKHMAALEGRA